MTNQFSLEREIRVAGVEQREAPGSLILGARCTRPQPPTAKLVISPRRFVTFHFFALVAAMLAPLAICDTAWGQLPNIPNIDLSRQNQAIRSRTGQFIAGAAQTATNYALRQSPAVRNQILLETQRTIDLARRASNADRLAAARRREFENLTLQSRRLPTASVLKSQPATRAVASTANHSLPVGFTNNDLATYDHIFGRYNPLRLASGSNSDWRQNVQYAARHRRAELSQLRDSALAENDLESLVRARRLEIALDAIVDSSLKSLAAIPGS